MKRIAIAAAFTAALAGSALAQTSSTSPLPAPRPPVDTTAPLPGANSFTDDQARQRIEKAGFTSVEELRKDDQGIWRATAIRAGSRIAVAVDYRGNVFPQ
jgi:hypothetical protein